MTSITITVHNYDVTGQLGSKLVRTRERENVLCHGPMTTFENWAAEVPIYMSLEDHSLATIMENVKNEKVPINDAG
eukprot:3770332-Amphidinium_carterae.2